MTNNTITSPTGNIKFLALRTPVKTYDGTKDVYKIRLEIDGTTPEGMAFREAISQVNAKKIVTDGCAEGHFAVNAQSQYEPKVLNAAGEEVEAPYFNSKEDTGTAFFQALVDTRGKQGTLHLTGVVLQDLELTEKSETSTTAVLDGLRAAIEKTKS